MDYDIEITPDPAITLEITPEDSLDAELYVDAPNNTRSPINNPNTGNR